MDGSPRRRRRLTLSLIALLFLAACALPGRSIGISGDLATNVDHVRTAVVPAMIAPLPTAVPVPDASAPPRRVAVAADAQSSSQTASPSLGAMPPPGLDKIKHFVFIMQENRSFDSYFGTYPGVDGIPAGVCLMGPISTSCVRPYHDPNDVTFDPPHDSTNAVASVDGGAMDGFLAQAVAKVAPCGPTKTLCAPSETPRQVMGYHDYRDIPNYWNYAHLYVLQDHMFSPALSYTLPNRLYAMSGQSGGYVSHRQGSPKGLAYRSITDNLTARGIDWKYHVTTGIRLDPLTGAVIDHGTSAVKSSQEFTNYNPLPLFTSLQASAQQRLCLVDVDRFYQDAQTGHLPAVSWITPNDQFSEHPPSSIRFGMAYVTGLVNAVMVGPDWNSTAIFISYDEWGGFYDHVAPPRLDQFGAGIRVPGIVISPYARQGYVDHEVYTSASWLRLVEERFGLPALTTRDAEAADMRHAFDFTQAPRPPIILAATIRGSAYPQPLQTIQHSGEGPRTTILANP